MNPNKNKRGRPNLELSRAIEISELHNKYKDSNNILYAVLGIGHPHGPSKWAIEACRNYFIDYLKCYHDIAHKHIVNSKEYQESDKNMAGQIMVLAAEIYNDSLFGQNDKGTVVQKQPMSIKQSLIQADDKIDNPEVKDRVRNKQRHVNSDYHLYIDPEIFEDNKDITEKDYLKLNRRHDLLEMALHQVKMAKSEYYEEKIVRKYKHSQSLSLKKSKSDK